MQEKSMGVEHIIGSAVMDNHYNFTIADEEIYQFLGDKVIPLFTAYIHPEDREAFVKAVEESDKVSNKYVTVRLKNFSGQYCETIIFIKPSAIDPDKFFSLEIYDIVYLVQEYNSTADLLKKLTYVMQLMKPAIVFDYVPDTGILTVFEDRDMLAYRGNIDEFYTKMVEKGYIDKMHISGFHKLIEDVKRGTAGVSCTLNMKVKEESKNMQPMSIRTAVLYDKDSAKLSSVVGIAASEEQGGDSAVEKLYSNRSNLDPLTSLYNKAAIKEMAIDALANADEAINYIMLDLDHFKEVNDTYGHMFGDEVILNCARIIKDVVGRKGFVGRVGGDEFFIVLKGVGTSLEELRPILRAIRSQIEWAYKGKLGGIKLTTSIGCASYPKDADNYEDLFKLADRCLYFAKTKGRNRFIIYVKEAHGSLEEIKAIDNSIKIGRTVSDLQRLEFVTDTIGRLSDWKRDVINSVLKDMLRYFDIDEIRVYDVDTGKVLHSSLPAGTEESQENICTYFNDFKSVFRESNVLAYGDTVNLKIPYPEFYEYMEKNQYFSMFVYAVKDRGEITHLVAAYTKGRYEKWSDMVSNFLCIIFKTIGDKIIND